MSCDLSLIVFCSLTKSLSSLSWGISFSFDVLYIGISTLTNEKLKKLCMTDNSVSFLTKVENFVSTIDVGGLF